MPEPDDEEERQANIDWLYRRRPNDTVDPLSGRPARVTSTYTDADIKRREQRFLAQRSRGQAQNPPVSPSRTSAPPVPPPPARRKRRRPVRRTIVTLLVLVLMWVAYTAGVPIKAWADMRQVAWQPASTQLANQPGTAILLVGSDSRDDLTQAQKDQLGVGDAEGSRTDTIMILYVPPSGRSVLISVPRDSYVDIPGYGKNKINAAFSYGGAPLLVQTLEGVTGLRIDGYMEVGFDGFANIINAVNGVDVCLDSPMVDPMADVDLPAGCQKINGNQALGYVRERENDPLGDLGRAKRQREVITKVAGKLKQPSTLLNPVRWWNVNMALGKAISRGKGTGPGTVMAIAHGMLSVSSGKGLTLQVPVSDPNSWSDDGQSVVIWDQTRAALMFSLLAKGDTSQMDQFAS